jgi:hypothetical protein
VIIESLILSVIIVCESPRYSGREWDVVFNSAPSHYAQMVDKPNITVGNTVTTEKMLAQDFGTVPQVKYILTEECSDTFLVWVVVDDATPQVRHHIFAKQLSLITEFPEIPFDFNLIRTRGRIPENIVTGAHVAYTRSE